MLDLIKYSTNSLTQCITLFIQLHCFRNRIYSLDMYLLKICGPIKQKEFQKNIWTRAPYFFFLSSSAFQDLKATTV